MKTLDPMALALPERHQLLLGAVGPRPIAFASTIDAEGRPNLAPFSFFNVFSSNPPILIFSPARAGRDGKLKDTLLNVREVPEVVINVVNYDIVQQTSLASTPYEKGINEFEKAGLTAVASEKVRPLRVVESPVQFECKVQDIIELGEQGGAGNLVISQIVLMHFHRSIFDENEKISPNLIDLVSRMGGNYYCRAAGDSIFEIDKPIAKIGIGVDQLPDRIRYSKVLTGNHLGMLGTVSAIPSEEEANSIRSEQKVGEVVASNLGDPQGLLEELHTLAADELMAGNIEFAWKILMCGEYVLDGSA